MIVILDTATGQSLNFKTRNEAAEFVGVSLPKLRSMLAEPFFLYKNLILTFTSNEKVQRSRYELAKKLVVQLRESQIKIANSIQVQGVFPEGGVVPLNGSRSGKTTGVVPTK